MKRYACLLLASLFLTTANAQTLKQVLGYYNNINQAELAICDSDFAKANTYYIKAFAINSKKPFRKDLFNAFGAAMDTREYTLAERYMTRLLQKGMDSESLSVLRSDYQGESLQRLDPMIARHPNNWDKTQQKPLVKQIKKMVKWDRDVRMYFIEQMHMSDYMTDSVYMVDAINARDLRKLLQEHHGPNEDLMDEARCNIIMWHNNSASFDGRPAHLFDTLLFKAFLSFDMPVAVFAGMAENTPLKTYFTYKDLTINYPLSVINYQYQQKTYAAYYDDTSEQRIDRERAKIGLAPLADMKRKIETSNKGLDPNSVFHKYSLMPQFSTVSDLQTEMELSWWLCHKGKDATVKPAYDFANVVPSMKIGNMDSFSIDKTNVDSFLKYYGHFYINDYRQGKISLSDWKGGKLRWNCYAEMVDDPKEDLHTETGRSNCATFVPGYRMFVEDAVGSPFHINNILLLFDSTGTLVKVSSDVNYNFNRMINRYCGRPKSVITKNSTKYWLHNDKYPVKLTNKKYTWETGTIREMVTTNEDLNKDADKRLMSAELLMTDTVKYNLYLNKVAEARKKLDMKYANQEK